MLDLNKVMLIGRVVTEPDVKRIESSGISVINFTVATNRKFKNKEGNIQEEAEYHRCVAYGNSADVMGKYGNKWKRIYIEWRLKTRSREDTAWLKKFSTEIIVDNFIFLDPKGSYHPTDDQEVTTSHDNDVVDTEDLPF